MIGVVVAVSVDVVTAVVAGVVAGVVAEELWMSFWVAILSFSKVAFSVTSKEFFSVCLSSWTWAVLSAACRRALLLNWT